MPDSRTVWVLDYGAGNIRSVLNAIQFLGFEPKFVENVDDLRNAPRLLFPGVGAFGRYLAWQEPLCKCKSRMHRLTRLAFMCAVRWRRCSRKGSRSL